MKINQSPFLAFLVLAVGAAGCAAPSPKVDLGFVRADLSGDNTYVGTRVREKAMTLRYAARMRGMEGRDIPVRFYLVRNAKPELISEVHWQPDKNATEWQWVLAYVPFNQLVGAWNVQFTAVAVSLDDPDGYYDRIDQSVDFYALYGGLLEGLWGFEKFEEDVDLGADQRGVRCAFWFEAYARQSHSFRASLVVLNPRTLQTIRVPSTTFGVTQSPHVFENIGFEVRYSDIASMLGVVEGDDLIFYPLAEWDDGRQTDNLYVDSYAFGNPNAVAARLESARDAAARQATSIEQALGVLKQAGN